MRKIAAVRAIEILDSRGNPTVRAFVELEGGLVASASVPSGASTGQHEAVELRDGDPKRYGGKGVLQAVAHVNDRIAPKLVGRDPSHQAEIDRLLLDLDGTPNKSKLGANAILGVSIAVCKAGAAVAELPLYAYLGGPGARRLPVPCMNILNGGAHADNSVDFQEFMVIPLGAPSFAEGLRWGTETFHALKRMLAERGLATSVGDEGGFAPNLASNEAALELLVAAIETAGYRPGEQVALGIDSAASSLSPKLDGSYELRWSGGGRKTSAEMIELCEDLIARFPVVLWEDPLSEGDWDGFQQLTAHVGDRVEVVGDDIFVTNPRFIERGIRERTANAALIKLNQIGSVTETLEAIETCRQAGWRYFLSHRSGETEDSFLADLAVATGCGHVKTGSACRSERLAKYNRLLEIEAGLGDAAVYVWPGS
jgi:enolase